MEYDPNQDYVGGPPSDNPLTAPQTTVPNAQRLTGPVTDPNDPRLADPAYASDPEVLKFLNAHYGEGGTAFNPPSSASTWNPQSQAWNPDAGGNGGPGGGTLSNVAGNGSAPTPFNWPGYTPPTAPSFTNLQAPTPYQFTPFSYADFSAPTLAQAQAQPGYQFGLKQGQDALQNSAAARGTLRGGGTLKDLFDYTNAAAEQNYGNVFNQNKSVYDTNREGAFGTWGANEAGKLNAFDTNWNVAKDVNTSGNQNAQSAFANARTNATDVFNPQFQSAQLSFSDMYSRWLAKLNSLTNLATAGAT